MSLAFSLKNNPGAYAVLVGAGISKPAVPTAWEVLTRLIVDVAALHGEQIAVDAAEEWWTTNMRAEPRYETVLEKIAPSQIERQRLLKQFFERDAAPAPDEDFAIAPPTIAHQAIARLVKLGAVKVIVTMNFDHLLEAAIRAEGIEPTVAVTEADIRGLAPLHTLDCCIIHLHGDYLYPESMLNTQAELHAYRPVVKNMLRQILVNYGLIVSGWSARYDPALREAIKVHYPLRFSMLWMEPIEPLSAEASQLVQLKNALLLRLTAQQGFGRIADAVESMQVSRARHPLTARSAAETAKRELSGRWTAIRLHDTLQAELADLHANSNFHLPDYNDRKVYEGYADLVSSTEEATKVTASLVAVLAYWGRSENDDWWLPHLERFAVPVRSGGLTALLELRMVAGSILFYSAGVSAVLKRRYGLLARILRTNRDNPLRYGRRQLLSEVLDPGGIYEGFEDSHHRHYLLTSHLLAEALSISGETLSDAWQEFEILRLATLAQPMLLFQRNAYNYNELEREINVSLEKYPDLGSTSVDPQLIIKKREQVNQRRLECLNSLAQTVPLTRQHLLARDSHGMDTWVCPVAQRLKDDLWLERDQHPTIIAGIGGDVENVPERWLGLSTAIQAVSHAVGRRGDSESWRWAPTLPDRIWLDTGKPAAE
ncbi:hypothetical protein MVAC_12376 [Mycolicibacterium vaccae ATCC 25954]|uniref:Uncharacterized protein n=2 Tax=Mycolicibacterium vaccae TaxID=1810 RepID=K0UQV9_MYCVA|nr:hypothetical protein MVAC_12376 [Mycolicibacterium vaccae ATCC 25954]